MATYRRKAIKLFLLQIKVCPSRIIINQKQIGNPIIETFMAFTLSHLPERPYSLV